MSWPATVIAHLDEACGLAWKMLMLIHQLGVDFGVVGGMQKGVKAVLCIFNLALQEGVLIAILFLSEDDLGEGLVDFSPGGVAPFVGADIKGGLSDGAFEGLGKDGVDGEGVLVFSRVELVFAGVPQHVVDLVLMCKETS